MDEKGTGTETEQRFELFGLASPSGPGDFDPDMGPVQSVTLSEEQVGLLIQELSTLRHDVNNHLSLIVAAAEIIKHKSDLTPRMLPTLLEEPQNITRKVARFSELLERTLGISRES